MICFRLEVRAETWVVCLTGGPTLLGEVMLEINVAGPDSRRITAAKGVGGHMVSRWGRPQRRGSPPLATVGGWS